MNRRCAASWLIWSSYARAGRFVEVLSRRWAEQGFITTAYLNVDGHVQLYTEKRKLAEVQISQRRKSRPGVLIYFVNDQQGRRSHRRDRPDRRRSAL